MSAIDTAALRAQLALAGAEHFSVVSTKTWCSGICDPHSGTCDGHETGRMTDVELAEEVESSDDLLCLYGANGQAEARAALIGNVHANTAALLDEIDRLRVRLERAERACAEGLPREIMHCPHCGVQHIDGENGAEFATRPHHTHLCHACHRTWDRGYWSFGARSNSHAA